MPYIKQLTRDKLNTAINALAFEIIDATDADIAGVLNYCVTSLVTQVIEAKFDNIKYQHIATITGVLENVKQEFYRRFATPFEDLKLKQHGDIPLYKSINDLP